MVAISAANTHDSLALQPLVASIPPISSRRGPRRRRPDKLHGDKGYDYPHLRRWLRSRGITPRIARRGIETSQRLGRHRWVIERTMSGSPVAAGSTHATNASQSTSLASRPSPPPSSTTDDSPSETTSYKRGRANPGVACDYSTWTGTDARTTDDRKSPCFPDRSGTGVARRWARALALAPHGSRSCPAAPLAYISCPGPFRPQQEKHAPSRDLASRAPPPAETPRREVGQR